MNDKELLEKAAKAAGIELEWFEVDIGDPDCDAGWYCDLKGTRKSWSPLTDDGDALRLAVKLAELGKGAMFQLNISKMHDGRGFAASGFYSKNNITSDVVDNDLNAATRRAIVRAAAEIGKEMK